jgi:hypothetical protein
VQLSWADFVLLSNRGRAPLFCLGCKTECTTSNATNLKALAAPLLIVGLPAHLIFFSGMLAVPEWSKIVAVLLGLLAITVVRAVAMERFADALVSY